MFLHKGELKKTKSPIKNENICSAPPASAYSTLICITEQYSLPALDFSLQKLKPYNANQQIQSEVTSS